MLTTLRRALAVFGLLTVLTGVAYPLLVTGIAQTLFHSQANGSIIERDGHIVGSHLLGQSFNGRRYFWPRPSATTPQPYNGASSSGSNQAPTNPALSDAIAARVKALREADPANAQAVPVDLVTASASGLDPHLSIAGAMYQADRVARERGMDPPAIRRLIAAHTEGRTLGFLGEPRVNVLELNLALDALR